MSEKRLYALTDSEASELRRLVDAAQLRAWAEDDADGYKDTHYLMARLNTPLDRVAAVERMAEAIYDDGGGDHVWVGWAGESDNVKDQFRQAARAALASLHQENS